VFRPPVGEISRGRCTVIAEILIGDGIEQHLVTDSFVGLGERRHLIDTRPTPRGEEIDERCLFGIRDLYRPGLASRRVDRLDLEWLIWSVFTTAVTQGLRRRNAVHGDCTSTSDDANTADSGEKVPSAHCYATPMTTLRSSTAVSRQPSCSASGRRSAGGGRIVRLSPLAVETVETASNTSDTGDPTRVKICPPFHTRYVGVGDKMSVGSATEGTVNDLHDRLRVSAKSHRLLGPTPRKR